MMQSSFQLKQDRAIVASSTATKFHHKAGGKLLSENSTYSSDSTIFKEVISRSSEETVEKSKMANFLQLDLFKAIQLLNSAKDAENTDKRFKLFKAALAY